MSAAGAGRTLPWQDRRGRFSALRAGAFGLAILPALVLGADWIWFGFGARPLTEAIHQTGFWAVRFLLVTLAITPARFLFDWSQVVVLRRMAGLTALAYAVAHLGFYIADQKFHLGTVISEILVRRYLTIGFAALLGLALLGATSTDATIRRLGRNWKVLHRLAYLFTALGILHFFMQSKADVFQAAVMAGLLAWLLIWRLLPRGGSARWIGLAVLVPLAGLATLGLEAGWYTLAVRARVGERILAANWDWESLPRPADWVTGAAVLALLLAGVWGLVRRRLQRVA